MQSFSNAPDALKQLTADFDGVVVSIDLDKYRDSAAPQTSSVRSARANESVNIRYALALNAAACADLDRRLPGEKPMKRLNARLNAASDA